MTLSNQAHTKHRLLRIRTDERGMSFVFIGMGMMAFLAASMLAIDVGQIAAARTQAQRSADAGALAGATALVFNSYDDRSPGGPAVTSAVNTAKANNVINQQPSVEPGDVTFPFNPVTGRNDIVQVTVYRNAARLNPVANLIGPIFGIDTADIQATAKAAAVPAGGMTCVLPLTIPDRWIENQTGPWTPDDTFDVYATQGQKQNAGAPLANPDVYYPPGTPNATGYKPDRDKGLQIVLKNNNQGKVAPSFYNPWDLPGSVGGDDYSENISGCNPNFIKIGANMTPENGNMVGPTQQGVDLLTAADDRAHWNDGCKCVKDSNYRVSPRVRIVPLYDPTYFTEGQHTGKSQPNLRVVNYIGFFIEDFNANGDITGRIVPITGRVVPGDPVPTGAFAQAILLVK